MDLYPKLRLMGLSGQGQGRLFIDPEGHARPARSPSYFPPEPPSEEGGKWRVHGKDIRLAVAAWVDAHRKAWPDEEVRPSPRDAGIIRNLVALYGPETWSSMAECACECWSAIREQYKVRATRPVLTWIMAERSALHAAAVSTGVQSRSHRGTWRASASAGGAEQQKGYGAGGGFGW